MSDERPNPNELLNAIRKEEAESRRARLKIFFGMSAGVGKTYTMLEAAHQAKGEGVDIVVGYVETHGRKETDRLVEGLECIPRRSLEYKGTRLEEMDIDAVLARKPQLVLVDELAHTNVPGSRHPKRYQDVLELLDNGIHVYTTLNVQHIESRADIIAAITGVSQRENVPDSLLDRADEIELIDISPDDLLKRLREGKVYTPERSAKAIQHFFRKGNLTALREMSLRLTAERVDKQLRSYMEQKRITGPWKSGERLLVAVGSSPYSQELLRAARIKAEGLKSSWVAVYIDTMRELSDEETAQLTRNLNFARDLGAEIGTISDSDVAKGIIRAAEKFNCSQIVVGKSLHSPLHAWLRGGTLVERLLRHTTNVDMYVVTSDSGEATQATLAHRLQRLQQAHRALSQSSLSQYLLALAVVAVLTICSLSFIPTEEYRFVGYLFLAAISVLSLFVSRSALIIAAVLSGVVWNYLFIPPRFTFVIHKVEDVIMVLMYLLAALVSSILITKLRTQERIVRKREEVTDSLYAFTQELSQSLIVEEISSLLVKYIDRAAQAKTALWLCDDNGMLLAQPFAGGTAEWDEKEESVARWTHSNRKRAGRFSDTLPSARLSHYPMARGTKIVGVVSVDFGERTSLPLDVELLVDSHIRLAEIVLERVMLERRMTKAIVGEESERLYQALISSVSHELRTPLAVINASSESLLDDTVVSHPQARSRIIAEMRVATERLSRIIANLLDINRLESGKLQLRLDWCDIRDVIVASLRDTERELRGHRVELRIPEDSFFVRIDAVLIEECLVNLLLNAAAYTAPGTRIEVQAQTHTNSLILRVKDYGQGIAQEALAHIFEKFYRAPNSKTGGTGLGLSIVRGFVEAHGGKVQAENHREGGAEFTLTLPCETMNPNSIHEDDV